MFTIWNPMRPIKRAFWIEFWLEKNQGKSRQDIGIIKEVVEKKEQRIYGFFDIIYFIIPYIENMDIKINWYWRSLSWMKKIEQKYIGHHSKNENDTEDFNTDS